ncbi:MAG: hypothetical protein ACXWKP_03685 [Bradyrhizobium sp.]
MSKFAIRLLTLALYATALMVVPMVTPAKAAAESSKHVKKKKPTGNSSSIGYPKSSNPAPSNNPYDEPDRKVSY